MSNEGVPVFWLFAPILLICVIAIIGVTVDCVRDIGTKKDGRISLLEDKLFRISELAHMAIIDGYSPKDSPAALRFECIANIADHDPESKGRSKSDE